MSGMFEPKTDKAGRKLAQTQKELKEKKKKRLTAIIIITVLVLVSAVAITINSNFIRRTLHVVRIDGTGFTAAEFEYFFHTEYSEYSEFMSQFQGMEGALPNPSRPLSEQVFNNETGETWADFITDMTLTRMAELVSLNNAAKAAGFVLSQEQLAEIDDEIAMVELQALLSGFPSGDMLLQRMFGTGMNEKTYRNIMEKVSIARHYSEYVRASFTFTPDSITGYYNEHRNELDIFNFRMLDIYIELTAEDLPDDEDDHETAINEAIAKTHEKAVEIAHGISNEADFLSAALEYNGEDFDTDSTLLRVQAGRLDINISDWMLDDARTNGETLVIDAEYGSTIVFFISRDNNEYRTTGMRQILMLREHIDPMEFPEGENDPDYIALFLQEEELLSDRAEYVLALFNAAGRTEQALIDLMEEHSDDTTEGGHYINMTKFPYQSSHIQTMRVVPEIEDWLFAGGRNVGDSELIYTEAFGYHLIYFTEFGDYFYSLIAEDRMRTRDHNEWHENLPRGTAVKTAAFILVHL